MGFQDLDIGEKAISKAAETAVRSQMDAVETLDVEVHTDPMKLAQGQIDKVTVEGQGLVIQDDLRTEAISLEARSVDIDMFKAMMGEVELERPADADAQVVLKAEDLQKALNSDFVKQKMRGLKVVLPSGEKVTTDASNVTFSIPEAGKILVSADVMVMEKVETHHIEFSARPELAKSGNTIVLKDVKAKAADNDMPALTRSLVTSTEELLDLRNFEIGDMALQFNKLEVLPGKLIVKAQATISSL